MRGLRRYWWWLQAAGHVSVMIQMTWHIATSLTSPSVSHLQTLTLSMSRDKGRVHKPRAHKDFLKKLSIAPRLNLDPSIRCQSDQKRVWSGHTSAHKPGKFAPTPITLVTYHIMSPQPKLIIYRCHSVYTSNVFVCSFICNWILVIYRCHKSQEWRTCTSVSGFSLFIDVTRCHSSPQVDDGGVSVVVLGGWPWQNFRIFNVTMCSEQWVQPRGNINAIYCWEYHTQQLSSSENCLLIWLLL